MDEKTLYQRLGGYDSIVAVVKDFLPRMFADPKLRRYWDNRGKDGIAREEQLLIDFLAHNSGGPAYYTGREMKLSHEGMKIDSKDYDLLVNHLTDTLVKFNLPEKEKTEVLNFINSFRPDIIEIP